MSIPIKNAKSPYLKRMATLSFLITGMAYHVLMVFPIYMYSWFVDPMSLGMLAPVAAVFSFYVSIYATVSPLCKPQRLQWCFLHRNILKMQSYRQECLRLYQMQGFTKWRWYALHWIGPLWLIASVFTFACISSRKGAFWVLLVGIVGWCIFFRLQIQRERRWCLKAGPIDLAFVYGRMLQLLVWYIPTLYVFHTYGNEWGMKLQKYFFIVLFLFLMIHACLAPNWFHLCFGQRKATVRYSFWGSLLETNGYGNFRGLSSIPVTASAFEKKQALIDILLFHFIVIFAFSCLVFLLYLL